MNRLSGKLPIDELSTSTDLNILLGNMFACHDYPSNDKYAKDYDCGSAILNVSILLLFLSTGCVLILFFVVVYLWRRQGPTVLVSSQLCKGYDFQEKNGYFRRFISLARNQHSYFTIMTQLQTNPPPSLRNAHHIIRFYFELVTIMKLWVLLCLMSIFLSVPIYVMKGVDTKATTHDHEYSWKFSWVYTTGQLPALLLLTAWLCLICCFILVIIYILWTHNSKKVMWKRKSEQENSEPLSHRKTVDNGSAGNLSTEMWSPKTIVLLLVNNALVVGVNLIYIYSTSQSITSDYQLLIQLLVAFFKQINSTFVLPYLCKTIKHPQKALLVRLKITILQTLLVPCLVTAFQNPSCLQVRRLITFLLLDM